MSSAITDQEMALWRDFIYRRTGILLGEDKAYLVEHRLGPLLSRHGISDYMRLYLTVRHAKPADPLGQEVIDAITTNETFWFRDPKLFKVLGKKILPALHREYQEGRRGPISIWSATCSSGQEPYSIAITALEAYQTLGGDAACREEVRIMASDISLCSLEAARRAVYDSVSVERGLGSSRKARYLERRGKEWQVKEQVRNMVEFRQFNLRDPLSRMGIFDLVFLRNTFIYFSDDFKRELLRRLTSVMTKGAYFFLGTGETITPHSTAFDLVDDPDHLYYRLADH